MRKNVEKTANDLIQCHSPLEYRQSGSPEGTLLNGSNVLCSLSCKEKEGTLYLTCRFDAGAEVVSPGPLGAESCFDSEKEGLSVSGPAVPSHTRDFKPEFISFSRIVFSCLQGCLVFQLKKNASFVVRKDEKKENFFSIVYTSGASEGISVHFYKNLREIAASDERGQEKNAVPLHTAKCCFFSGPGKRQSKTRGYAALQEKIGSGDMYLLCTNWHDRGSFGDLESHLARFAVNGIDFILSYDFSLDRTGNGQGIIPEYDKKEVSSGGKYIDRIRSAPGSRLFKSVISALEGAGSKGHFFKLPVDVLKSDDFPDILDHLNGLTGNRMFFANILTPLEEDAAEGPVFLHTPDGQEHNCFSSFIRLKSQGYSRFGFIFPAQKGACSQWTIDQLALMIGFDFFFVDLDMARQILETKFGQDFLFLLFSRLSLGIYRENCRTSTDLWPVEKGGKSWGYFFGSDLFISFCREKMFKKIIYIPEGRWYWPEKDLFVSQEGLFRYEGEKKGAAVLIKKESIVPVRESSGYSSMLNSGQLLFYVYTEGTISRTIRESSFIDSKEYTIIHRIKAEKNAEKLELSYQAETESEAGRENKAAKKGTPEKRITLAFVETQEVKKALINGREIKILQYNTYKKRVSFTVSLSKDSKPVKIELFYTGPF